MQVRILVTGASGLLGSKIIKKATDAGYKTFSGYLNNKPKFGQPFLLNLNNRSSISKTITQINPDVVIHCAALTDVDLCETDRDLARKINSQSTKIVAEVSNQLGAYMTLISTDYVFDGLKGDYKEIDQVNPINFYGHSKLLAEKSITKINQDYLIVRTSVIYGDKPASGKINFALWLIDCLKRRREVKIVTDQFASPTLNTNLADMILEACEKKLNGIYHMAGASKASRYEFAIKLAEKFNLDKNLIKRAKTEDMNWKAKRPKDSSLSISKIQKTLTIKSMNLDESLGTLKDEMNFASRNND
jgi:dTDP-4-dehydrorhamnose reductase